MGTDAALAIVVSVLLVLGSAFFVAAEYALISSRRSRVEALAKRGSRNAKALLKALDNVSRYVAGTQIAITLLSIGVGSYTEPRLTEWLIGLMGQHLGRGFSYAISILFVTFVLVVVGELCPKYLTLRASEKVALSTFRTLYVFSLALRPLIWIAQTTSRLLLKPFGVNLNEEHESVIPKEELLLLVQTGGAEGVLDQAHAEMVARALRLDVLAARDIMIHRLDVKWIDASLDRDGVFAKLKEVPYSRIPVCRGDIDDLVGIAYLHDILKFHDEPDFNIEKLARPIVAIPENLPMGRIVQTMREEKTQMLVVMDEYGGTSGVITLEDVVEEVFGDLEDRLESERPPIETQANGRISARADVRFDELVNFLHLNIEAGENTDTLAQMIIDALDRMPRLGDDVETTLGKVRVENMARGRITRVSVQILPELLTHDEEE